MELGYCEWVCFIAQQAAEKAVKALYQSLGIEVRSSSTYLMLERLPKEYKPPSRLIDEARELDRHYISTRYPNFYPEGAFSDYYTKVDAERAIKYAKEIINSAKIKLFKT